jgi:glycosyltransferase involved in cell wall biosynthesis
MLSHRWEISGTDGTGSTRGDSAAAIDRYAMKLWLIQTVLSPYRIPLFEMLSKSPSLDFTLVLLSKKFKTRPQWKRDLSTLSFKLYVPFGFSVLTGPEKQYCVNPFLFFSLLARRPDVVICGGYNLATLTVWLVSWFTPIRYVIWTEATLHADGHVRGIRLWLRGLMARRAGAFVDAGTLAREYVESLVPMIPRERLFRAFNCVDTDSFSAGGNQSREFFARRGFPEKNLLFVGKLNERKGVPQLLEVYRRVVAKAKSPVGLILIGEGELRSELEQFKQTHRLQHIRLEGWVKNDELGKYYAFANAFLLLSKVDHNPLVLFEALAAGIPIICSDGACNAIDFIQNGSNGYVVDAQNTEEVVERTLEVLNWDAGRRELCERFARETVRKANYRDAAKSFVEACRFTAKEGQR